MKFLVALFVVTAVLSAAQPPLSPFGIGTGYTRGHAVWANDLWLPQLREIDVRWYRSPPGPQQWDVEKVKGTYDFTLLDAGIANLDKHGMNYNILLWGHGHKGDKGFPKNDIEGWAEYVRRTVAHLASQGKTGLYYQIWNEPPNFTAEGDTAKDFARVVAAAYDAAKSADPTAKIGLTAKSSHINWLAHVIRHGAKDKFDYITLHPYEIAHGVTCYTGSDALYLSVVPTLRKMLRHLNPERADVPVMFTEIGVFMFMEQEVLHADTLVKIYVMGIAQGVAQIHWFEAMDGDAGPMGILDNDGKPRLAYHTYGNMVKHFGQYPEYLGWVALGAGHTGYVFKGADNKNVLAAWTRKKNATEAIPLGRGAYDVVDPRTGGIVKTNEVILANAPVFILDPPPAVVQQARANKSKPFQWDSDYTDAEEISISYVGGKAEEKGLHTVSGEVVSQAIKLYGEIFAQEGFRDGSTWGGDSFICDPNFLSYKTGPIEITITARRQNPDVPAGINLEFEYDNPNDPAGIHPYRAEHRDIPGGDGWHDIKWRLTDTEFNAYFGFHFRFFPGPYNVRNITVRKVR